MIFDGLAGHQARIGLLRGTPGLGDLLCTVPSWRALRAALPDAHMTLIAQPLAADVMARLPGYVDAHLTFPGFPGLSDAGQDVRATVRFLAQAQALRFDVVVQQHGDGRVTNVLACLLGGRRTAGFHGPHALLPDTTSFLPYPAELHEVQRHLLLMAHLGAPPHGEQLELLVLPGDRATAAPLIDRIGSYAVLHPGAADPARRWPPGAFAQLGRALARRGLGVVVTGGPAERDLARAVAEGVGPGARSLAGRTNLGTLAAVIDGARLVVSNDTGPAHVAVARDVPSVIAVPGTPDRSWLPLDEVRHPAVVGEGGTLTVDAVLEVADHLLRRLTSDRSPASGH